MVALLEENPELVFIPCEAAEILHEHWPSTRDRINLEDDEYHALLKTGKHLKPHSIMGLNYFLPSERVMLPEGGTEVASSAIGWNTLARWFYEHYQMPFLLSETNNLGSDHDAGPDWL